MDYKRPSEKPKPEFSDGLSAITLKLPALEYPYVVYRLHVKIRIFP